MRLAGRLTLATLLATALPVVAVAQLGRVEGLAFDSLAMLPAAGAQVWIPGTTISALANEKGRYQLDSVPAGRQVIAFSTPALDSLGLGTLGTVVTVKSQEVMHVNLGSPSSNTIWKRLCENRLRIAGDTGIVWGSVRDAATLTRLAGAPALFSWYDLKVNGRKIAFSELSTEVRTDSSGIFVACGLPTDVSLTSKAIGTDAASGELEFSIGARGVLRVDYLVSPDMRGRISIDTIGARRMTGPRPKGTSTVAGVVHDVRGRVVADALVSIASADTAVRTDKDGAFTLRDMPAGTHGVQVRSVGYGMLTRLVDLRPNAVTETSFTLSTNTTLSVFNVRAAAVQRQEHAEFLERRRLGLGYAVETKDYGFSDPTDAIRNIPLVTVRTTAGQTTVQMQDGNKVCTPNVFLDGNKIDMQAMQTYPIDNIRAVEVYNNKYTVPAQFITSAFEGCGVIVYWSRARW